MMISFFKQSKTKIQKRKRKKGHKCKNLNWNNGGIERESIYIIYLPMEIMSSNRTQSNKTQHKPEMYEFVSSSQFNHKAELIS